MFKQPKFRIGDLVYFSNDFSYNKADGVVTIGRINVINIFTKSGIYTEASILGQITYHVSGSSLVLHEKDLTPFDTMTDLFSETNVDKPLQLECGKQYKTAEGFVVTIADHLSSHDKYPFIGIETGNLYMADGRYHDQEKFLEFNLIEEI